RIRRIGLLAEQRWKKLSALLHEQFDVLAVNEICRELDHSRIIGTHAAQNIAEVREDLPELRTKVAFANNRSIGGDGELSPTKRKRAALHQPYMRVQALSGPRARRVFIPDLRHLRSNVCCA